MTLTELEKKACDIRADVVTLIHKAGCGHIGGDMSEVEALVALYYKHLNCSPENEADPDRDRFVLSKGHSVETLYCILADRGYFDKAELMDTYSAYGSRFIGHPNNKIPGVEMNSGPGPRPLGRGRHGEGRQDGWPGLPRLRRAGRRRLAEGSVWEGVMAGGHFKLDNLTALVDRNRLQISGSTEDVMRQDSQETRWAAFGWNVISIPGNDMAAVDSALTLAKETKGKPTVIILNTTKGCGVSFMENLAVWHHKVMDDAQYETAMAEIAERKASL
ncbi:MAG: transketolase [Oscillospiraceae bacterium]